MTSPTTDPWHSLVGALKWFDARWRAPGMWAFVLNRIAALGLTVYLFLHLAVLGSLAKGPEAYGELLALFKSPVFVFGEFLVVVASIYHGLNGIRIAITSFGIAVPYHNQMFYAILAITIVVSAYFGIIMFLVH